MGSRVPGVVGVDAQGHLVDYSTSLGVGQAVAALEEWGGRTRRQNGVGVVSSGEGPTGRVGEQGVCGQALGVCVWGS